MFKCELSKVFVCSLCCELVHAGGIVLRTVQALHFSARLVFKKHLNVLLFFNVSNAALCTVWTEDWFKRSQQFYL